MFVDSIIGKMHADILDVLFGGFYVDFGTHTDQSIVK